MKFTAVAALMAVVSAEDPKTPAKTPAVDCTIVKFDMFSDKDCSKALETVDAAVKKGWEDKVKSKACTAKTTHVCDAAGITTTVFKADDCKASETAGDDKTTKVAWGACVEVTKDKAYFKATSARAILAGSAAILAFAASQF